ncbi:MAG: hypothetical protein ACYDBB_15995 [Armatimonadota bacterium]
MRMTHMAHLFLVLLLLGTSLPGWSLDPPPNLARNGSFEAGTANWTLTVTDPAAAGNAIALNDALPLEGTADVKMSLYGEGTAGAQSDAMTVTAGQDYLLTLWYQAVGFSVSGGDEGVAATYTVTWYDGGGTPLGTSTGEITHAAQSLWARLTRRVNAPASTATAKITMTTTATLGTAPDSFFYLDNVKFSRCAGLVANGGFEGGTANWTTSVTGAGNTIAADTTLPGSDTTALKIDMPAEGTASATSTAMTVEPGRDYLLALQFRSQGFGAGVSASYAITWYDSGAAEISTITTSFPTAAQSSWTAYGPLRLNAPGNAATAKVRINMTTAAGSAASTAWIDQVDFAPDPYLLFNGSFEGGLTAWTASASGAGNTVSIDTITIKDGANALKLDLPAEGNATATGTTIPVSSGRDFLLTFWYKSSGISGSGSYEGVTPACDVKWYDGSGGDLGYTRVALPYAPQVTWTSLTRRVSPPANTASAKVVYSLVGAAGGPASTLWVDQATLDSDANQIPNGGFEAGMTGWTYTASAGCSVTADSTQAYEDLTSLKLDVPNQNASASAYTGFFPVVGGQPVEANVWWRSTGFSRTSGYDNVSAAVYYYYYNAAQQNIGSFSIGLLYTPQANWRRYRRVFIPPANAAYMKITIGLNVYTGGLPSTLWIDKLEILPYQTRLKPSGQSWLFRVADSGNFDKSKFRRSADDNTITGAAAVANPNFSPTAGYLAYAFYSTAVPAGLHRAVFRMKVADVSVTRNVASMDVNTPNDGLINTAVSTTDYFGQANVFKNLVLRFRKLDASWVDFRAYWQAAVRTAVDTVTVYEEEVDD